MPTPEPDDGRPWLCPQGDVCLAPSHDTYSGYAYGCRSGAASTDRRRYLKLRSRGIQDLRRPAWPTARRLRALSALGWPWVEVGARTGQSWPSLSRVANGNRDLVARATAEKVAALYDELGMLVGPSASARAWARKRGWAPPLAWMDIDDPLEEPELRTAPAAANYPAPPDDPIATLSALRFRRITWTSLPDVDREAVIRGLWVEHSKPEIADIAGATWDDVDRLWERMKRRTSRARSREQEAA